MSFNGCCRASLQDEFEHQLGAEKGEHQEYERRQRPANGDLAAPAEADASVEQDGEGYPGDDRQHGLVHQVLGENILEVKKATQQRRAEADETEAEELFDINFEQIGEIEF